MIYLIVRLDWSSEVQEFHNLTLKELGETLAMFGKQYYLVFETVREVESDIGCTMIVKAIKRD